METPSSNGSVSKRSLRRKVNLRNYDEDLMDELFEKQLGGGLKKRSRTKEDLEKETETEAMIAMSLGFPIDALLDEEVRAGVVRQLGGKEQNDYIVIRNHILALWRRGNVRLWLSKGMIRETVSNEYEHLINSAYDFLLYNGYINFGVSPAFTSQLSESNEGTAIVIGAGLAGLAAARQLLLFGYKVVVLEGRSRPGGRVYTQKVGRDGKFSAIDLGGSIITGIHANPLGVLARQLSIPLHKVRDNCPLYKPNGAPVDTEMDARVEYVFNRLLDKVMELRQIMGGFASDTSLGSVLETLRQLYSVTKSTDERQLLDWHLANLEYANAGCLSNLSAAYWDQDDPYEMSGDHCFLAGGNTRLIKALCEGVPIFYGKTVNTIRYGDEGVEVIAGDQVFQADIALCTVPLGVLKKKAINFEPELPARKLAAIERMGFGLLNKVAMVFPYVFWGEDQDTFGCLNEYSHQRGEFFLFYCYHTVSGGPALVALVAGEAAQVFESTNPSILLHRVLSVLKGIFHPKGIIVPYPIQSICTRWGSDPLSYGSYSHVSVHSSGDDYDILAENVGNRLFFAGEATSRQYPATMHGAFLSGLREASRIYRSSRLQNSTKKYGPKNIGPNHDILVELFKRPDFECGKFAFIFYSSSESLPSMGLLQVTFGDTEESHEELLYNYQNSIKWPLQLYTVLSREQAQQLQLVEGGDESRLSFLVKSLGLKLMGPSALFSAGNTLVANIAYSRKGRGRNRLITC
ncbi:lysine-specific histone demethylase 1 homolog 2 [Vigna angularis]|uniref:lysine-specific histone demethylase 1 homolog 2 n=1 Tax=Phaseolus angularis TaxID=3914 RepID=UPI00080A73AC|nr:lysine-specific histone demethylase 1 homolog 2 [Vigna angularis]XP_052733898.1 lysine-specific histone demethylase 1 homolog 2 [Vigna angularis]XP_052733899.1 lysine-specific histone demethylase 1 homolog 2 [Vigna angularis]XP_052733900.1 lysine-specific histone demethylase 1 homolog 2 [Vigna angularis]